jgi:hypothetical protein
MTSPVRSLLQVILSMAKDPVGGELAIATHDAFGADETLGCAVASRSTPLLRGSVRDGQSGRPSPV